MLISYLWSRWKKATDSATNLNVICLMTSSEYVLCSCVSCMRFPIIVPFSSSSWSLKFTCLGLLRWTRIGWRELEMVSGGLRMDGEIFSPTAAQSLRRSVSLERSTDRKWKKASPLSMSLIVSFWCGWMDEAVEKYRREVISSNIHEMALDIALLVHVKSLYCSWDACKCKRHLLSVFLLFSKIIPTNPSIIKISSSN